MRKLEVANRMEAVRKASELGLIESVSPVGTDDAASGTDTLVYNESRAPIRTSDLRVTPLKMDAAEATAETTLGARASVAVANAVGFARRGRSVVPAVDPDAAGGKPLATEAGPHHRQRSRTGGRPLTRRQAKTRAPRDRTASAPERRSRRPTAGMLKLPASSRAGAATRCDPSRAASPLTLVAVVAGSGFFAARGLLS